MAIEEKEQWICSTVDVEGGILPGSPIKPVTRGVAARDKRWNGGTRLKVCFLQGPEEDQALFMDIAKLWFLDGGVSLKLDKTDDIKESDIRVTFKEDYNNSLIGTDSRHPNFSQKSTLNVAKVTPDRVLHEFGHALGLAHEHCHPSAQIPWNKKVVYADLAKPPNKWDPSTVDKWVFEQFDASKEILTNYDKASVMMYPIRANWTTDGKSFTSPSKLSEGDKATIRKLYPA